MSGSQMAMLAAQLRRHGFDKSRVVGDHCRLGCSQCEALAINGKACHETGCPNDKGGYNNDDCHEN